MEYLLSTNINKTALYNNISQYLISNNIPFNQFNLEQNINNKIKSIIGTYNNSILQGDIREQLVYYNKMILVNTINEFNVAINNVAINNVAINNNDIYSNISHIDSSNNTTPEQNYLINQNNINKNLNNNFINNLNISSNENSYYENNTNSNKDNMIYNYQQEMVQQDLGIKPQMDQPDLGITPDQDNHKIFKGESKFDINKLDWTYQWDNENNQYFLRQNDYKKICLSSELKDHYKTSIITELEGIHKLIKIFKIEKIVLENNNMKVIFSNKYNLEDFRLNDKVSFKNIKCVLENKEPYDIDNNYKDLIQYLENNLFDIHSFLEDFIIVEINNFLNLDGELLLKGSCLNNSKIPEININYEIKYR